MITVVKNKKPKKKKTGVSLYDNKIVVSKEYK
jgi:hypothetical protein